MILGQITFARPGVLVIGSIRLGTADLITNQPHHQRHYAIILGASNNTGAQPRDDFGGCKACAVYPRHGPQRSARFRYQKGMDMETVLLCGQQAKVSYSVPTYEDSARQPCWLARALEDVGGKDSFRDT
jgi:hypothetical protein